MSIPDKPKSKIKKALKSKLLKYIFIDAFKKRFNVSVIFY